MIYIYPLCFQDSMISDWSDEVSSIFSDSSTEITITNNLNSDTQIGYYPPVLLSFGEQCSEDTIIEAPPSEFPRINQSHFDVPLFLNTLIEDVTYLGQEIKQKSKDAALVNLEETLSVLTVHNLIIKMRMEATVKELESILDGTYTYEQCSTEASPNNVIATINQVLDQAHSANTSSGSGSTIPWKQTEIYLNEQKENTTNVWDQSTANAERTEHTLKCQPKANQGSVFHVPEMDVSVRLFLSKLMVPNLVAQINNNSARAQKEELCNKENIPGVSSNSTSDCESTSNILKKQIRRCPVKAPIYVPKKGEASSRHVSFKLNGVLPTTDSQTTFRERMTNVHKELIDKFSKTEGKKNPRDQDKIHQNTDMQSTSKNWIKNLLEELNDMNSTTEQKENLCISENIQNIHAVLENYDENDGTKELCIKIILDMTVISDLTRLIVIQSGSLAYLGHFFKKYWPERDTKEAILTSIFYVFITITQYESTSGYLLNDFDFDLFLLPLAEANFSVFNILAGHLLSNLLFIADSDWKLKLSKGEIDEILINNMEHWQLGKFAPIKLGTFRWVIKAIKSGTMSQKRYYAWTIVNLLTKETAKYTKRITNEDGAIAGMEAILVAPTTDEEVRNLVEIFLNIIRKEHKLLSRLSAPISQMVEIGQSCKT